MSPFYSYFCTNTLHVLQDICIIWSNEPRLAKDWQSISSLLFLPSFALFAGHSGQFDCWNLQPVGTM